MKHKVDAEETLGLTTIDASMEEAVIEGDNSAEEDAHVPADEPTRPVKKGKESPTKAGKPSPKDDPSRLEYWQSQADRMKAELEQFKMYTPVVKLINENPEVLDVIDKTLEAKRKPPEPEIIKPVRPSKPASFDEVAAVSDPESPSFKYNRDLMAYQEQLVEYTEKREELRDKRERERTEREKMTAQARTQEQSLRVNLRGRGFNDEQVDDFIAKMGAPESVSLDNLVELYRIRTGTQVKGPNTPSRKTHDVPLPVGAEGGGESADDSEPTEEENFNLSIVDSVRKHTVQKRFTPLGTTSVFRK